MKNFKAIFLSTIFVFGLMSMADINEITQESADALFIKAPCSTVYTICDNGFPDDYDLFMQCMDGNGCGG